MMPNHISETPAHERAASPAPHLHPDAKQRRVVCAANRILLPVKGTYAMVIGPRHYDPTMRAQIASTIGGAAAWRVAEQGFIDQWGTFMTREEALAVALAAGQRIHRCGGDETRLYSENLY